jgi:hypothetical protein
MAVHPEERCERNGAITNANDANGLGSSRVPLRAQTLALQARWREIGEEMAKSQE